MWKVLETWVDKYFGDEEAVLLSILLLFTLVLLVYLGEILAPFFTSVVIAFLLQGGVTRLIRIKVPKSVAVWLMFVVFIGIVLVFLFILVPLLINQATNLVTKAPGMIKSSQQAILLI